MPIKKRANVRLSPEQALKLKLKELCDGPVLDPQGRSHLTEGDDRTSLILVYPEKEDNEHPSKYFGPFDTGTEAHEWANEFLKKRKYIVVPLDDPDDGEQ